MCSTSEDPRRGILQQIEEAQAPVAVKEKLLMMGRISGLARQSVEARLAEDRAVVAALRARLDRPAFARLQPGPRFFDLG